MVVKKFFSIAIIFVLALSLLTACGGKDNNGATSGNGGDSNNTDGGLYDIDDSKITVSDGGDLSALPDYLKKCIGGRFGAATLKSTTFQVTCYEAKMEQLHDLFDYYSSNCGTVASFDDEFIDDMGTFEIKFDWGQINVNFTKGSDFISITAMFY